MMATYFVFDIAYLKTISAVMLFFQHTVFEIRDKQAILDLLWNFLAT